MDKKHFKSRREFLNLPFKTSINSMIGYQIKLDSTSWGNDESEKILDNAYVDFKMSDCNSFLELDFPIHGEGSMENSIHKIDTMISVLKSLKKDIRKAKIIVEKGKVKRKKFNEKDKE